MYTPERRGGPRIRAYRPVRLHVPRSPRILETLTKDLSVGGMCCLASTPFPVSTHLNLELVLSSGDGPVSIRGKTVWFRTIPYSDQFDLGISFSDIPDEDRQRLSAYLSRLAQKYPLIPA